MAKDIIGIDISDSSIEAVVLFGRKGHYKIGAYSHFRLSPDIVRDGRILQPDKLKEALQKLLKIAQPKAIKGRAVFLSIPESRVYSHVISLPRKIKDKAIKEVAQHKAEEMIPENPENLVSIIKILPASPGLKEVFYAAADVQAIKDLVRVFQDISLEVIGITSEAISSYAGLSDKQKKQTTLLLDIGSRTTIASVFSKEGLLDTININIAGDNISQALVEKLGISVDEAEDKKRVAGLESSAEAGQVMMIIQGQLQPLVDEIKKFIRYQNEAYGRTIEKVILIGGLAQMKGIDKYFGENLGRPIAIGQAFMETNLPADLFVSKYINALGLAKMADGKGEFNFYTSEAKKRAKADMPKVKLALILTRNFVINKYILLSILLLLILFSGYYFRDYAGRIFKNNIVGSFTENTQIFSKEIAVGLGPRSGIANYVAGEYFETLVVTDQIYPGMDYAAIADYVQAKSAADIIAGGYTASVPSNYYLIPEIAEKFLVSFSPPPEEFQIGQVANTEVSYKFITVANEAVKQAILGDLPAGQAPDLSGWLIAQSQYELIDRPYQTGVLFTLKATMTLERP